MMKYKVGYLYRLSWEESKKPITTISECVTLVDDTIMIVNDVSIIKGEDIDLVQGWHWSCSDETETCKELGKKEECPEYYL